jgi:hypothetical protein
MTTGNLEDRFPRGRCPAMRACRHACDVLCRDRAPDDQLASSDASPDGAPEKAGAGELGHRDDLWGGQIITGTDTLVMYIYGGDTNLDDKINIDDYGHIDTSVGIGLNGWFNGDFNHDGTINIDDYGIIDVNVGIQGPPFSTAESIGGGERGEGLGSVSTVPEPVSASVVTAIAAGATMLARRRRRF